MFKKTTKSKSQTIKKTQPIPVLKPKKELITESLKAKAFPLIVAEFIQALKSLKLGESIRFGKLGSFKKLAWQRKINGRQYQSIRYKFKPFSELKK